MHAYIDMMVVFLYLAIILLAGFLISRKHVNDTASEFMTGGRSLNWWKTGLNLIAMSLDTGIMGVAGLGFVWGLTIQWNAANLWVTAPLAAMFLIPIYWRSRIVTTPELLERRFSVHARVFFSLVMSIYSVIILGTAIYLGGLILTELFGWDLYLGCIGILVVVALYVMMGGMKTVLSINVFQAIFILATLFLVAIVSIYNVGGLKAFAAIKDVDPTGQIMPSTLLPFDLSLFSEMWYPLPSGLVWASMAGAAWIACNYAMVQRLLAAKNEQHAQKAILFTGVGHVFTFIMAYAIGVAISHMHPETMADKSYLVAIFEFFPVGIRGLLIAGLIASLLSTIDGLITSASTMITSDIYLRFIKPNASDSQTKTFARIIQGIAIGSAMALIPAASKSAIIFQFIQSLVADLFGVVIALYLVGIFTKRATPKAAMVAMIGGLALAVYLDFFTGMAFTWVGIFSFLFAFFGTLIFSLFEKPVEESKLKNITLWTLEDVKGPWVGLAAWPNLWKVILGIFLGWWTLTAAWEIWIRTL